MIRYALIAVALLLHVTSAVAEDAFRNSQTITLNGTVRSVAPDRVVLSAVPHPVEMPPALVFFEQEGRSVTYGNLRLGHTVTAHVRPFNGRLSGIYDGFLSIETRAGSVVLPASAFAAGDLGRTGAYLRRHGDRFTPVPLDAGLAMQAGGEGALFANLPSGAVVGPPREGAVPVPPTDATALNLPAVRLRGVVSRLLGQSAELTGPTGVLLVPAALGSFEREHVTVAFEDVIKGDNVRVWTIPFSATVLAIEGSILRLDTAHGPVTIPLSALPQSYRETTVIALSGTPVTLEAVMRRRPAQDR